MASTLPRPAERAAPAPPLPPAVGRALAAWGPAVARRAAETARACLAARFAADGADAFGGSRLTGDGFPLEIAVSTADHRLRLTFEPGSRRLDPRRRIDAALDVVAGITGREVDPAALDRIRHMHAAREGLRYGAWVGCRVEAGAIAAKLYAEIPPGTEPGLLPPLRPALYDRPAVPCMIGCPAGAEGFELYWRLPSLLPAELPAVLEPAGLEGEAARLLAFIEEAHGCRVEGRLPGASVGVSYAHRGGRTMVTLFFFARALWGSDARIRRGFARAAGAAANLDPYWRATAPLADRETWATSHALIGVTPAAGTPPALTIGFRPVSP